MASIGGRNAEIDEEDEDILDFQHEVDEGNINTNHNNRS